MYKLFLAFDTAFCGAQFFLFNQLINFNHESIHMCWSFDLNELDEVLVFSFGDHTITARYNNQPLNKHAFRRMIADIKGSVGGWHSSSLFSFLW